MNPMYRNVLLWIAIVLGVVFLFQMFSRQTKPTNTVPYSEFVAQVKKGGVTQVIKQGETYYWRSSAGTAHKTTGTPDPDLIKILRSTPGLKFTVKPEEKSPWYLSALATAFPMILLIAIWIFFMRQMQAGGGKAMSFGKSRARLLSESPQNRVTFEDVAGIEEAKEELTEIIEFLRDHKKFTRLGGRIPKGVLLVGPPGTGKTLLARAIAGEAGVPFFSISGSDFVEMFVGVGASRVRDLFVQGKKNAPCIIFIDELDAVGRHRGAGLGGGHDEREQTLNQLLVEMDGFEGNEGVILVAATNRPDVLDPALLRPGRFDRQVVVPVPDIKGREEILRVHSRNKPMAPDVDLKVLARGTPGFSGADLENLVNEAALLAARANQDRINMLDLERAKDKVLMGVERKSMIISDEEKRTTAYHEAGHAVVAIKTPGSDPIHKVTIIPRGRALGLTQLLPVDDRHTYSREYLLANLDHLMGGRAAEELVTGQLTTGAGNDIERATDLARKMVCSWGMSDLGPLTFGQKEEQIFLGRELATHRDYSEQTAQSIDDEVYRFVSEAYRRAKSILEENIDGLHRVAQALLEVETLEAEEVQALVEGREDWKKPAPPPPSPPAPEPDEADDELGDDDFRPVRPGGESQT